MHRHKWRTNSRPGNHLSEEDWTEERVEILAVHHSLAVRKLLERGNVVDNADVHRDEERRGG